MKISLNHITSDHVLENFNREVLRHWMLWDHKQRGSTSITKRAQKSDSHTCKYPKRFHQEKSKLTSQTEIFLSKLKISLSKMNIAQKITSTRWHNGINNIVTYIQHYQVTNINKPGKNCRLFDAGGIKTKDII